VGAQVRLLRILLATIAELDRALGAGLLGHAKAGLLAPLPRIGEVSLAQVVAEVGPILDRASTVEHATAECGAAPVTKASGKSKAVTFRWAANTKARNALATLPATPGTAHPGRPRSTPTPAAAASTIPTPSASWLGPGCGSCGPAGTTTRSTTPPGTAQNGGSSPELDSGNSNATSPAASTAPCKHYPTRLDGHRSVRLVKGHRALCPFARTIAVVSLTIARWPLNMASYAIAALLPTPLGGTPLRAR
jgi:hypothetical protein